MRCAAASRQTGFRQQATDTAARLHSPAMGQTITAVLILVGLGGAAAGLSGRPAGYAWAAFALLGLVGHVVAGRARQRGFAGARGPRTYSMVFAAVLAVTGSAAHRGAFTGLAILWAVMALAAVWLVIGIERRVRKPRQRQAAG